MAAIVQTLYKVEMLCKYCDTIIVMIAVVCCCV